jgi:hypothetical protein
VVDISQMVLLKLMVAVLIIQAEIPVSSCTFGAYTF